MDARLDSAFDSWGHFTRTMTDQPDIAGRLSFDPVEGIGLELVRSPTGGSLQTLLEMPSLPALYGRLVSGTLVTLVDCIITNLAMGAGAVGLPTALSANRMLVGAHVENLDQLNIKSYTVELSSLTNWTCASPNKLEMPKTDGKCIGVDITYRNPDPIHIDLSKSDFDFKITHWWNAPQTRNSSSIRWHAGVTIAAHDSMMFAEVSKVAWQCENLMSLLIGDHLSAKSIAIKPVDPVSEGTIASALQLIYEQIGKHDRPDLHASQMLLPYSVVKGDFPQIVAEWFARSEQAVLASNVFFGSQLHESPALEVRFLAAIEAAESYHRSLETGVYMKQDEYDSAIAGFLSHIPTAIEGDHRQSLKNRLKYGNEHSLRKRLTVLLDRIPQNARSRIAGDVPKFVNKVVDTRNYFTHYDHEAQANAFEGHGAFVASERLHILVVANLLHDLGIKDEILLSVLERKREFQHWMSQDLPL